MLNAQQTIALLDELLALPNPRKGMEPNWAKGYIAMRERMRRAILRKYKA